MKNVAGVRENNNLNKEIMGIEKCFINNEYKKDKGIVYFYPFLYAKKHMEFY